MVWVQSSTISRALAAEVPRVEWPGRHRVIFVCGGRGYADRKRVFEVLDLLQAQQQIGMVILGGAQGNDALGLAWAQAWNIPVLTFSVNWDKYGRSAGPRRNAQMLKEGKPDLVVAFPGGRGTANMIEQARKVGVEVMEIKA